jgi:hypothetical protein
MRRTTVNSKSLPLSVALTNCKNAVVKKWYERVLQTYPESTTKFLSQENDPFSNPVGHTLKEGLSALFDSLSQPTDVALLKPVLEGIVRIRAVQDFTAGQAVSFLFLLKKILRAEFTGDTPRYSDELAALEAKIDELALLAFDVYVSCRERVYEIKFNEAKRKGFVLERAHQKEQSSPLSNAR